MRMGEVILGVFRGGGKCVMSDECPGGREGFFDGWYRKYPRICSEQNFLRECAGKLSGKNFPWKRFVRIKCLGNVRGKYYCPGDKCPDPLAGLHISACSSYDLCQPG